VRLSVKKKKKKKKKKRKKERKKNTAYRVISISACFRDIKPRAARLFPLIRAGGMLSLTGDGHVSSGGKCYRFHD